MLFGSKVSSAVLCCVLLLSGISCPGIEAAGFNSFLRHDLSVEFFNRNGSTTIEANSTQCDRDIARIWKGLVENRLEAIQFVDSWGRIPFGLLWGHDMSFGQFEECLEASYIPSESLPAEMLSDIRGQYCLVTIPFDGRQSIINNGHDQHRGLASFEMGICVPNTCQPEQIDAYLKESIEKLFQYKINRNRNVVMVKEKFCSHKSPLKLRIIDIVAILFACLISGVLICSTTYDCLKQWKGEYRDPLLITFSIITNARKIFASTKRGEDSSSSVIIHCLNGIRCITMLWVIFGNGYFNLFNMPLINRNFFYQWVSSPYSMLVQNGSVCVDTFFFISGLLLAWKSFAILEKTSGQLNIPLMYLHRYMRLTPSLAIVMLYIMSVYKYTGHGPMWMKYGTQDERCSNTWWATLLYVQNYVYPNTMCISQSWYLAVDMQLYLLSPLFLLSLWKWRHKAIWPIALLGLLSVVCTFIMYLVFGFTLYRVNDPHVNLRQKLTYLPTHTRLSPWLIGLLFGYFLHHHNRSHGIRVSRRVVLWGWILTSLLIIICLWGPYWRAIPQYSKATVAEAALYESFVRCTWTLCIAWVVWACHNGYGGFINDFLSWNGFASFGQFSYSLYITHRIVQFVNLARLQHDTYLSDYDAILDWWHNFGITLTVSVVLTFAIELPVMNLEATLLQRFRRSTRTVTTESREVFRNRIFH